MGEPNLRDELEKVWVPKDVGELEGLLLTIQNESGKKILKHKVQQILRKRRGRLDQSSQEWPNWSDQQWPNWGNQEWPNWGNTEQWPNWSDQQWPNWGNQQWPNWSDIHG